MLDKEFKQQLIRDKYLKMISDPERYDIYEQNEIADAYYRMNAEIIINAL